MIEIIILHAVGDKTSPQAEVIEIFNKKYIDTFCGACNRIKIPRTWICDACQRLPTISKIFGIG